MRAVKALGFGFNYAELLITWRAESDINFCIILAGTFSSLWVTIHSADLQACNLDYSHGREYRLDKLLRAYLASMDFSFLILEMMK